ncbi:CPBP family intramembrane glutamic endopeptidase [Enterovibrio norvegicus]|uniref:CAAX prenyl protease 2/Lysostaphin resistance protein A-like domain-containing protein n=1 Tax=Enterovibrio norvegicus TaxID=188144 RepID=A0A2N7LFY7_9GAMM|nr:CPBP family intramembrane glutamic endopeptidase [Enterovibrio norvegicus]PMN72232.1 hypothetical protein BCT27_15410 [Enterovibrio norvegicus]PMN94445.1 hypothetical protein BCT23_09715 [Enterovibrio norvegicus]
MTKNAPNILVASIILIILFALELLLAAGLYDAGLKFEYGDPRSFIVAVPATGIVIATVMHFTGLSYRNLFHVSDSSAKNTFVVLAVPILLICVGSSIWLTNGMHYLERVLPEDPITLQMLERILSGGALSLFVLCVLAPLLEEMLFRGIILRGFLNHYSPAKSIVLSSLLFGVFHANLYQFISASIAGCFFAWLFYKSRSLWPSIFAHSIVNGCAFVLFNASISPPYSFLSTAIALFLSLLGFWVIHIIFYGNSLK